MAVLAAVVLAGGPGSDGGTKTTSDTSALKGIPQSGLALGSPKAPVTIVEFADLQCPFCAEYHRNVFPSILDRYVRTGKVRLELRLLRFLGPDSDRLAAWPWPRRPRTACGSSSASPMTARAGRTPATPTNGFINKLARDAGLRAPRRRRRRRAPGAGQRAAWRKTAGIDSTPSFLIGQTGGTLHPFQPSDLTPGAFIPKIDSELGQ